MRQQMDKPSYFYNGGKDTLWAFYNHATVALQQSHPRTWMEDQRMLHWFITNEVGLATPAIPLSVMIDDVVVDPLYEVPNQTNILDQIAEVESEVIDLDAEEDEAWEELEAAGIIAPIVEYTDPAGNTFEAPVVEEKLSLDDILIRIPNEEKASLSPFEKMQQRLEEANARIEAEASLVLTPEEMEEHREELNQIEALEAEVAEVIEDETPWHEETVPPTDLVTPEELITLQEKLEAREVKVIAAEILKEESTFDFDFDLGEDADKSTSESNDFDFFG
jgi:hypothetical protein